MLALNPDIFKSYSKYIPKLYDNEDNNGAEGLIRECIGRYLTFTAIQKLDARYRLNVASHIANVIGNSLQNHAQTQTVILGGLTTKNYKNAFYITPT